MDIFSNVNVRTLSALGEPNRLRIVELLRDRPYAVTEISRALGIGQPQASKHLSYLNRSGLVTVHPLAQKRIYSLRPEPFEELSDWLGSFETFWTQRFSALDDHIASLGKES